jgi:CDP-diglyceride synthetase
MIKDTILSILLIAIIFVVTFWFLIIVTLVIIGFIIEEYFLKRLKNGSKRTIPRYF